MLITTFEKPTHNLLTEHLTPGDVGVSLARTVRYAGMTPQPYSVLWHSLVVAELMTYAAPDIPQAYMLGLLHDIGEVLTRDFCAPVLKANPDLHTKIKQLELSQVRLFVSGNFPDLAKTVDFWWAGDGAGPLDKHTHLCDLVARRAEMAVLLPEGHRRSLAALDTDESVKRALPYFPEEAHPDSAYERETHRLFKRALAGAKLGVDRGDEDSDWLCLMTRLFRTPVFAQNVFESACSIAINKLGTPTNVLHSDGVLALLRRHMAEAV